MQIFQYLETKKKSKDYLMYSDIHIAENLVLIMDQNFKSVRTRL